ncbi:hypothetical protein [Methylobacterium radiotolerans]|uniref:hypothetical protein n=1 Tax=Methylobacterium radiotolerans TaxID=31998 RepID=UPI001F166D25|nr:hypothetical protein [Methylobacterium radiotolerans]UIY44271.1 hypothetical protein LZ599_11515 [Methylobacterium radiotolerans]
MASRMTPVSPCRRGLRTGGEEDHQGGEGGAVSLLPVRFAGSRIAGPIADGGRVIYCVSGRMYGRTFGKPERPRVVLLDDNDRLSVLDDDEVCAGHRTRPFPELDALGNKP